MTLTKYHCMICGRVTDPQPEYECDVEQTLDDICDECKDAVMFVRQIMSQRGILVKDNHGSYQLLKYSRAEGEY